MQSPFPIIVIAIFLILGAAAVIVPAEASVFSNSINNSHTYTNVWAPGEVQGSAHINVQQIETVAGASGVGVPTAENWAPNQTTAYVISVPYGSLFWQTVDTSVQVNHFYYSTPYGLGVVFEWSMWMRVNVTYQQYDSSANSLGTAVTISSQWYKELGSTDATGYPSVITAQTAIKLNFSQYNINAMYGILTFNVFYHLYITINGDTANSSAAGSGTSSSYAQMYVVPGTGLLNLPSPGTVIQGGTVSITGETWYGNYALQIHNPQGVLVQTISVGQNLDPFTKTYTVANDSSSVGEWNITLLNSVVRLEQTQFLTVLAYHGKNSQGGYVHMPSITISQPAGAAGYYSVGQKVTFSFSDTIQPNMIVTFLTFVYVGTSSQEPPPGTSDWIPGLDNANLSASASGSTYTYTSSFIIPAIAANNTITFIVYATATNSSGYFASQPNVTMINVGYVHQGAPNAGYLIDYLEIIGFLAAGGIAAYLIPGDVLTKFGVFGASLFSAVMVYAINIIHIGGL